MKALLAATVLLAAPQAAEQYVEQVQQQLSYIEEGLAAEGVSRSHDYAYGQLDSDGEQAISFELDEGRTYVAVAVCDQDCSDIDLVLLDENGNVVSEDHEAAEYAAVKVTPAWTGSFDLRVKMYTCSAEPCHFGVAIFGN